MCLDSPKEDPCPGCGGEVYFRPRTGAPDGDHCYWCWYKMSEAEKATIMARKELEWQAQRRAFKKQRRIDTITKKFERRAREAADRIKNQYG